MSEVANFVFGQNRAAFNKTFEAKEMKLLSLPSWLRYCSFSDNFFSWLVTHTTHKEREKKRKEISNSWMMSPNPISDAAS
eukprot:m.86341 g.86341  ORF g.86341 m.86341 type:complete len:80 (-) comp21325_c0_seq2:283-522(-)